MGSSCSLITTPQHKQHASMRASNRINPLANAPEYRSIKDVTKALQIHFTAAKIPLALSCESRRMLQNFVDGHDGKVSEENSSRANLELKNFWEQYVGESPHKLGAFIGVLRELRPAITGQGNVLDWWLLVVKPVISGVGYRKSALDDAKDFLVGAMVYDNDDDDDAHQQAKISNRLRSDLLNMYIARSRGLTENDQFVASDNAQIARQVEDVLVAFGQKQPKDLFHSLDDMVRAASTRLQALTLLSAFLRHQAPHLYLVVNTPLVEDLLKCLMNDTSTTVLSVALSSLIMLLPHIPGSLGPHLPRLFLVYSRLLCWERFSPLSSEAQKNTVTDDRVSNNRDDAGDVGVDPNWEKARPVDSLTEEATPELMTYFTYIYGLYPVNFMSYIRKPRRYLKNVEFPGADDFDLDQAVIRSRTQQFQQMHLLHPNFYNMTIEEELIDPKWPRMDPADVVGECNVLYINSESSLTSPGPPPTGKLPDLPPVPPLGTASNRASVQISPSVSYASFRSGTSWRDTPTTAVSAATGGESPVLRSIGVLPDDDMFPDQLRPRSKASATTMRTSPSVDDFPQLPQVATRAQRDKAEPPPQTNLAYLQREITLLRNDLNFERWHKAQYSQHIGQISRKNVKDATAEAETLNLINANRLLKQQLERARQNREGTIKDSALTRKQANNLESNMTERFNRLRQEQEIWQADGDELRRLRSETKQYRELLVAAEARELNQSRQLQLAKRDLQEMQKLQDQLEETQQKLHEYEYREFDFKHAVRERDILLDEKQTLQMRVQRHEQDRERLRRAYADRVTELEAQMVVSDSSSQRSANQSSSHMQVIVQQAIAETQAKLMQLKKSHSRLLEKHTDLELEYQSVKSQLEAIRGNRSEQTFLKFDGAGDASYFGGYDRNMSTDDGYDVLSHHKTPSEDGYTAPSTSDPSNRSFQPPSQAPLVSSPLSQPALHREAGLTWQSSASRKYSLASRSSGVPAAYNQSAPLTQDETKSAFSDGSSQTKKEKIQPDSQVRVYGRGRSLVSYFVP